MGCVGRIRTCTKPVSRTGELPITRPRTGAWRRARTADIRVTRAMLWPTELPRQDCWAGLGGGPRSRTAGLEGQHAACLRHSQVFADGLSRAVRHERARAFQFDCYLVGDVLWALRDLSGGLQGAL